MLTDKNIDKDSARYWCIFCSSKGNTINEAVMTHLASPDKDLARAQREYGSQTDAQKSVGEALLKLRQENGTRLKNELKYVMKGMDQKDAQLVGQKLIADFDANGEKLPAMMARELGETFMSPEKVMPDGSTIPDIASGSNLEKAAAGVAQLSSGKAKSWLGRTWDVIKGYWSSLVDTVSEWFLGGKWEGSTLPEKIAMLKTGGIHALEIAAIAYLVYKIRGWLFPQLKLAWKNIASGDALAKCTFNDNDGNSYLCWFDKSKMEWQVKFNHGISALAHQDDLFMTHDQCDAFFSTKFFDKFVNQCEKYISPYLDEMRSKQQLENKDTPSDVKKMLKYIVDNSKKIRENMFSGSYSYFAENEEA